MWRLLSVFLSSEGIYFFVEGGLLWCTVCGVPVRQVRWQTVVDHLEYQKHGTKANKQQAKIDANRLTTGPAPKRQATVTGIHNRRIFWSRRGKRKTLLRKIAFLPRKIVNLSNDQCSAMCRLISLLYLKLRDTVVTTPLPGVRRCGTYIR